VSNPQARRDSGYEFLKRALTGLFLIILFWIIFFKLPPLVFSVTLVAVLATILLTEWPQLFPVKSAPFWLIMPIYPVLPVVTAIALNHIPAYRMLIVYSMIIVYCFDFGSYTFGSIFGLHKVAPAISPRKTWEGVVGGFLFSYFTLITILYLSGASMTLFTALHTTLALSTLALCGDFFESYLKRRVNLKDSGRLLPGHGGLLDRLDSVFFVIPVVYLFRHYFARIFELI